MRILHCCLSNFYFDGYGYQENILPTINKADGHEVKIIASTESITENSTTAYVDAGSYETPCGIPITRIPYRNFGSRYLNNKLKFYKGLVGELEKFNPDVILYHGTGGGAIRDIIKYKKRHPHVKLYMDSHEDYHNSATNWVSKNIQHKLIHAPLTRHAYPYLEKLFYISEETKDFLIDCYKLPTDKMEFYPLGGVIIDGDERQERRTRIREELGLSEDDILLCHSGKLDKLKRTSDILKALAQVKADNLRLVIIGSTPNETKGEILSGVEADERVSYLGWKTADELLGYLCACDLYVQPGSQSATMQSALCCGAAVMLYPHKSHNVYLKENGWLVEGCSDMSQALSDAAKNPEKVKKMGDNSLALAKGMLDYRVLAARLYV